MTWYHRGEQRLVEYGSSFLATLAEGTRQMVDDVLVNLNLLHLSPARPPCSRHSTTPVWSRLGQRYVSAAVPVHTIARPAARRIARRVGIVDAVYGPRRYLFGELFASDQTGAPRNFGGRVDRHGGRVGRWLVTRDGFDFLFLYLYETDAAQHRAGDVMGAVRQADEGVGPAGRGRRWLGCAAGALRPGRHRRSLAERGHQWRRRGRGVPGLRLFRSSRRSDPAECDLAVTASNRFAMAYLLPGGRITASEVGHRMARQEAADVVAWREGELVRRAPRRRRAAVPARRPA